MLMVLHSHESIISPDAAATLTVDGESPAPVWQLKIPDQRPKAHRKHLPEEAEMRPTKPTTTRRRGP